MKMVLFSSALLAAALMLSASCLHIHQSPNACYIDNESSRENRTNLSADSANANGTYAYTVNNLPHFESVDVSSGIILRHIPTGNPTVTVSMDRKDDHLVQFYVDDGELRVGMAYHNFMRRPHVVVTVTGYTLYGYEASSGASIRVGAPLKLDRKLSFEASSGANIQVDRVQAPKFKVEASSGGEVKLYNVLTDLMEADASSGASITLSGRTQRAKFEASSGATLKAERLSAQHAEAEASSGGEVMCNAATLVVDDDTTNGTVRNVAK